MRRSAPGAVALALLALASRAAAGAGKIEPGAYCPLPEEGEPPQCLQAARAEYGDFFQALDEPGLDAGDVARVEADVTGGDAYLALSSLSYGYYRLAQRVAASPGADPELVARLERWNGLLARAYDENRDDPDYREAVRTAALDIRRRAPAVTLRCVDSRGEPARCDSTEAVIRGIDAAQGRVGIRGALRRVLERLTGGDDS